MSEHTHPPDTHNARPLPLKWRPQQFDEIVGQPHVVRILRAAVERHRVAHAYLFSGPRGSGKTSTARILAKALNCIHGPTVTPCQTCPPCVEITTGRSPDVLEIDGASNRGINEIRNLQDLLRFRPMGGKSKIVIIDEVHMLTTEAFNALLKTLEEPPSHVVFIFATTEPQKVPLTIVSRCQHLEFHRIREDEIYKRLVQISETDQIAADPDALRLIARAADGSLRDALSLLEQARIYTENTITATHIADILGLVRPGRLLPLARYLGLGDLKESLLEFHRLIEEGYDLRSIIDELLRFYRLLLWHRIQPDHPVAIVHDDETLSTLRELLNHLREEDVLRIADQLLSCYEKLRFSEDPMVLVELTLARICRLPALVELERVLDLIHQPADIDFSLPPTPGEKPPTRKRSQEKTPSQPLIDPHHTTPPSTQTPPPAPSTTEATPTERLIQQLRNLHGWNSVLQHLQKLEIVETSREIVLTIPESFAAVVDLIRAKQGDDKVREVIRTVLGRDFQLRIHRVPNHSAPSNAPSTTPPDIDDPDVRRYQQTLDGRIIAVQHADDNPDES